MQEAAPSQPSSTPVNRSHWWGLLGLAFAAWFGSQVVGSLVTVAVADGREFEDLSGRDLFAATLPFQLVLGGAAVLLAKWSGDARTFLRLDAFQPSDVPVGLFAGAGLQLLVGLIYLPLVELLDREATAATELVDRFSGTDIVLLFLMAGLLAPVVEELFFRGVIQGALGNLGPPWLAVSAAALFFAATHFQLIELLGLFMFGAAAGMVLNRFGRMSLAITVHMGFNLASLIVLVTT